MQANLVFTPFARLRAPLGIAMLKAYVEKNSDFRVKCFDISRVYSDDLADTARNDKSSINSPGSANEEFRQAIDFFKNSDNEGFFDQAAYNWHAIRWIGYYDKIKEPLHEVFRKCLVEDEEIPWFVYDYAKQLLVNKPDIVGFSLMFDEQFYCSALIAKVLKKLDNNIKIVFGGYVSNTGYEELFNNPFIDFIVLNEGEESLLGLMKALNGEQEIGSVPNLVYRENGKIVTTEAKMITNLEEMPFPDFSDFDLNSYFSPAPLVSILGSKGCYWRRCTFCVHHKSYFSKYRAASAKRVVDEMEHHVNNGVRHFDFVDEMISAKRFRQIGEEILNRKLEVYYYALAKPTADFTEETFEIMYKSGCRYIIWGVESGCQRILDLIDKGTKVEDMSVALRASASAGIKNHIFLIVGFPSETKEELGKTLDFIYEHKDSIHAVHKGIFSLHKGSLIYENPEKFYISKVYDSQFSMRPVKYEVSKGLDPKYLKKCNEHYGKNYFTHFNYFSPFTTVLRGHALFHYCNEEKLKFNAKRITTPTPQEVGPPPALNPA